MSDIYADPTRADGVICAQLTAVAIRHAQSPDPDEDAAVDELRQLSAGRGDLLSQVAGLMKGRHNVEPTIAWNYDRASEYCLAAGGTKDDTERWIIIGQNRATTASN